MLLKRHKNRLTNYVKRQIYVDSAPIRIVIRRSAKNIQCALVENNRVGDKILQIVSTRGLKFCKKANKQWAYAVGYIFAQKVDTSSIKVVDSGLFKLSRSQVLMAVIKGFNKQNETEFVKKVGEKYV